MLRPSYGTIDAESYIGEASEEGLRRGRTRVIALGVLVGIVSPKKRVPRVVGKRLGVISFYSSELLDLIGLLGTYEISRYRLI